MSGSLLEIGIVTSESGTQFNSLARTWRLFRADGSQYNVHSLWHLLSQSDAAIDMCFKQDAQASEAIGADIARLLRLALSRWIVEVNWKLRSGHGHESFF